ncbi:MAG: translation elongation factor Ts [Cyanobacteriota bacterium]|nr:translation elongation factor Ts [Cyanobacteriota bacterium]
MADITSQMVKELREKTGAGMMDCKKALVESKGDMEAAITWLRQKGLAGAAKKAGRVAAEGLVDSYIHTGGRIGILVEVNCETDFVARRSEFKDLVRSIAMQIAACPNVEYVSTAQIPVDVVEREKTIEMGKDDLGNKPANVREKIVQGRIDKRLRELSLLDQPYVKDQSITIEELVKQSVALLGENIQIRRFTRFVLGEGIEKETVDFAAEVAAAAQSGSQPAAKTAPVETPSADAVAPMAAVSVEAVGEPKGVEAGVAEESAPQEAAAGGFGKSGKSAKSSKKKK